MPQAYGMFDYIRAAFNARPFGMFVPPNWIGLGAFALLGTIAPGFWVLGAGLELGYLALLATNPRFQRTVSAGQHSDASNEWERKIATLLERLDDTDRRAYNLLSTRCGAILDELRHNGQVSQGLDTQSEGLGRLLWMYMRLLLARQAIRQVLREAERGEPIDARLASLEAQIASPHTGDDLRRSLTSQAEILRQRLAQQTEAKEKLAYLDAELTRIQEQVELIREQAALTTDPEVLSQRIDQIAATLGGTGQWIRDQQQVYGAMEDLLTEPPPVMGASRSRESQ
jgi:hypothetical protein